MKMLWVKVWADDWFHETQDLSDAEKGRLMDALMSYINEENPESYFKGGERLIFRHFEKMANVQFQEFEKNRGNGAKGGRPKKTEENPTEPIETQRNPKKPRIEEQKNRRIEEQKNNTTPYNPPPGDAFADFAGENQILLEALRAFEESRKKLKKPMTPRAKELLIGELVKAPAEDWVTMLENATLHGWQSVYPLKHEEKPEAVVSYGQMSADRFKRLREREAGG